MMVAQVDAVIRRAGSSRAGVTLSPAVLADAAARGLFNGAPCFYGHPRSAPGLAPYRIGTWEAVTFDPRALELRGRLYADAWWPEFHDPHAGFSIVFTVMPSRENVDRIATVDSIDLIRPGSQYTPACSASRILAVRHIDVTAWRPGMPLPADVRAFDGVHIPAPDTAHITIHQGATPMFFRRTPPEPTTDPVPVTDLTYTELEAQARAASEAAAAAREQADAARAELERRAADALAAEKERSVQAELERRQLENDASNRARLRTALHCKGGNEHAAHERTVVRRVAADMERVDPTEREYTVNHLRHLPFFWAFMTHIVRARRFRALLDHLARTGFPDIAHFTLKDSRSSLMVTWSDFTPFRNPVDEA